MASIETQGPSAAQKLYFAAWRWHFYAGLFVIPFLLMLAVTGFFMMLFTTYLPEYGDRLAVTPGAQVLTPEAQVQAAMAAVPGATGVTEYITPYDAETPARLTVTAEAGDMVVALNPYDGTVLRQTLDGDTWNLFFETIHGTLMIGTLGDRLIEIATGLGLVMVVTGLYLWWPRNGAGIASLLVPQLAAKGRAFWKSLHQVTGFWISIVLVFFLITGLSWAGVWGEKFVQAWSTFPAEKWDNVPLSDATHASMNHDGTKEVPWGLEQTPMPESGSAVGGQILAPGTPVTLDSIVLLGRTVGLEGRFRVAVPADDTGVWTISQDSMSYDTPDPTGDRTLHVDQFTGKVLADVRYADYGLAAKAMAVGIALHEGQMGLWNFVLNTLFCLAVVLVCVSGVVMWWVRRPAGAARLAAPPMPADVPLVKGAVVIVLALSLMFPLVGLTLAVVLALDILVVQNLPQLKRALS